MSLTRHDTAADAEFASYVAASGTRLTRVAYLLTRDHHLAEDLTQESLARLHRRWSAVERRDNPDAYVRKIMVNLSTSWRRRRRVPEQLVGEMAEQRSGADPSYGVDDEMWQLVAQLPPQQRAVLVLRYYEDLSDDQIAVIVGCSPVTVRAHASKGIAKLRLAMPTVGTREVGRRHG